MAMNKKPEHKMHLTDYLWMLRKRVLLILLIWGVVFAVVMVATFMQEARYKASAILMIEQTSSDQMILPGQSTPAASEEFYNSQYQLINSRQVARKLYNEMRMYNWSSFRNAPPDVDHISVVQNWIRVSPKPKTHLVEVWITWPDATMAAEMVNRVTDAYTEIVEEFRTTSVERAIRVLSDRSQDIERKLAESARAILTFSQDRQIFAMPEIRSVVLVRERWLQDAASEANLALITARSRYDALKKAIDEGVYTEARESETMRDLLLVKYGLERAKALDSVNYTQQHRRDDSASRGIQVSLEEVERSITVERQRMQRAAEMEAAQVLASAEANYEVLSKMQATNREALTTISQDLMRLETLQKQQLGLEEIKSTLGSAAETVRTLSEYQEARVRVINKADVPKEVYSPNPPLNLSLGAVVGLMVGIGAAFFFEYLNTTVRMPRDIEDGLGLPVLGFVPAMSPKLGDFSTRALISHLDPNSGPAEAFRGIRTEIMLRSELRQVRTGLVTSTSPGEGKTTVAINWAIALARAGNKVLLVDADLRKPNVHRAFNMANDRGLSTLLSEAESATVYIRKTDIENLHVLPGGPLPQNPAELLGSRKMRTLLAEAAERYDSVIIDSAPVLGVADANILGTMVDCVVLVVQASKNRRAHVMRARNQLASVNARLAGAVLNNVRGAKGDYYYYMQYYRPVAEMMAQQENEPT